MKQYIENEPELRKYLLGELMPDDALRVEARLFLEEEYSKLLKAAEDDLVDEYVNGELAADERERFERHFLSDPARYDDLKIARALKKYISAESAADAAGEESVRGFTPPVSAKRPFFSFAHTPGQWLRLAAAVAFFLVVAGAAWRIFNNRRTPGNTELARIQEQPTPAQAQSPMPSGGATVETGESRVKEEARGQDGKQATQESRPTPPSQEPGRGNPPTGQRETRPPRPSPGEVRSPSGAFAVMLIPGGAIRDEGSMREVVIPPRRRVLSVHLPLVGTPGHSRYEATLYGEDGQAVRSWTTLKPTTAKPVAYVAVKVPATLLSPQHYQMKLRAALPGGGMRDISSYHFRAVNKQDADTPHRP